MIAIHAGSRAMKPGARAELRGLGYVLVSGREPADGDRPPELRIVDERHLDRIPGRAQEPDVPLVLLTGKRPLALDDPRIRGRAQRPAGMPDLYPLLQEALEAHPRKVPRVDTLLPARCIRADHRWPGAVTSLSEGGCLLRSTEELAVGSCLNLQFALPGDGLVSARARCLYRLEDQAGLGFSDPTDPDRHRIRGYISLRLSSF